MKIICISRLFLKNKEMEILDKAERFLSDIDSTKLDEPMRERIERASYDLEYIITHSGIETGEEEE